LALDSSKRTRQRGWNDSSTGLLKESVQKQMNGVLYIQNQRMEDGETTQLKELVQSTQGRHEDGIGRAVIFAAMLGSQAAVDSSGRSSRRQSMGYGQ
jgi:hypothetical protein